METHLTSKIFVDDVHSCVDLLSQFCEHLRLKDLWFVSIPMIDRHDLVLELNFFRKFTSFATAEVRQSLSERATNDLECVMGSEDNLLRDPIKHLEEDQASTLIDQVRSEPSTRGSVIEVLLQQEVEIKATEVEAN